MRRKRGHLADQAEIDMTPMLDVTFIMLIFFIVTTSFAKEIGLTVNRPSGQPVQAKPEKAQVIAIQISENNQVKMGDRFVDVRAVRANVERARAEKPDATVVIITHKQANTGTLVQVIDQARLGGAQNVTVAAAAS